MAAGPPAEPRAARRARAAFAPLGTSMPPQSPVAWSYFITGLDPGGHGIFDFVHRDPKTMVPYLSTARTEAAGARLTLGNWQFPLGAARWSCCGTGSRSGRRSKSAASRTTIVRMPANFPPSGHGDARAVRHGHARLLGTYGTFSFYTSRAVRLGGQAVAGGERLHRVGVVDGVVAARRSTGPTTRSCATPTKVRRRSRAYVDPDEPAAKIVVGRRGAGARGRRVERLGAGRASSWCRRRRSTGCAAST